MRYQMTTVVEEVKQRGARGVTLLRQSSHSCWRHEYWQTDLASHDSGREVTTLTINEYSRPEEYRPIHLVVQTLRYKVVTSAIVVSPRFPSKSFSCNFFDIV